MAVLDTDDLVLGDLFQVNTTTTGKQEDARIAVLSDGSYVVTWTAEGVDYSGTAIVSQRYDADGNPIGAEKMVNQIGLNNQEEPDITALADGGYVIVWNTPEPINGLYRIGVMHYDADGNPVRNEFAGNNDALKPASNPKVTALDDGGYVLTWTSEGQDGAGLGTYFQRFDSLSGKVGPARLVPTTTAHNEESMDITTLSDGYLAIAWADETGSYVDLMDMNGIRKGTTTIAEGANVSGTAIAHLTDGGFVATWRVTSDVDGQTSLYSQRYNSLGHPVDAAGEIFAGSGTVIGDGDVSSSVVGTSDGGYFMTWSSLDEPGKIYGRHIGADGFPTGNPIAITEGEFSGAWSPQVDIMADGSVMVTFEAVSLDGSQTEIYSRRISFDPNAPSDLDEIAADIAVGRESIVASDSIDTFSTSEVTATSDGGYLVSWIDEAGVGFVRHYNQSGQLLETIEVPASSSLQSLAVEELANGAVAVAWREAGNLEFINYNSFLDGVAAHPSSSINTGFPLFESDIHITAADDGSYIMTWANFEGNNAQRFDPFGLPLGDGFEIGNIDSASAPTIKMLSDGGFVASWLEGGRAYAQIFDASNQPVHGGSFELSSSGSDSSMRWSDVDISVLADGGFVAVLESHDRYDFSNRFIETRRFDTLGNPLEASTTEISNNAPSNPDVVALGDGGYVVFWAQKGTFANNHQSAVKGQRFGADGLSVGDAFIVNNEEYSLQKPQADLLSDGSLVVTWTSSVSGSSQNVINSSILRFVDEGMVISSSGVIHGGTGSDAITGTGAADIYVLTGNQSDYQLHQTSDGYRLTDLRLSGGDGFDLLNGIEILRFADGDIALSEMNVYTDLAADIAVADPSVVNILENYTMDSSEVTTLSDGSYLINWVDTAGQAFIRRYDNIGQPLGDTQQVLAGPNRILNMSVTALDNGLYALAWAEDNATHASIHSRIFFEDGSAVAPSQRAATNLLGGEFETDIVTLSDGSYIVTWSAANGQRFDSQGLPVGETFSVAGLGNLRNSDITALADGGFVISWSDSAQVHAQIFDGNSLSVNGGSFALSSQFPDTFVALDHAEITALSDGGFVASFMKNHNGVDHTLYTRRFDALGQALDQQDIFVSNNPVALYGTSDIVALSDGGYMVVWSGYHPNDTYIESIYGRRFGADGLPAGDEFMISDVNDQGISTNPQVDLLADNSLVVTWGGFDFSTNQETVNSSILRLVDNDVIFSTNDIVTNSAADEILSADLGDDIYEFGVGDGSDIIINNDNDAANSTDIVKLDTGITANDLWFRQEGDDLVTQLLGTDDQVTIQDWYDVTSKDYQAIDQFELADGSALDAVNVQALVDAMAGFAPTDIASNNVEEHEDYNNLQTTLAASWG